MVESAVGNPDERDPHFVQDDKETLTSFRMTKGGRMTMGNAAPRSLGEPHASTYTHEVRPRIRLEVGGGYAVAAPSQRTTMPDGSPGPKAIELTVT